jgi:hypothetical protein
MLPGQFEVAGSRKFVVCLSLERWIAMPLLDNVGQFVRQQALSGMRSRRKLPRAEHDIPANRVGTGTDGTRRRRCLGIHMHAHQTEIVVEAALHEVAGVRIEPLSRPSHDVLDDAR